MNKTMTTALKEVIAMAKAEQNVVRPVKGRRETGCIPVPNRIVSFVTAG
jgi:hypothetical protein